MILLIKTSYTRSSTKNFNNVKSIFPLKPFNLFLKHSLLLSRTSNIFQVIKLSWVLHICNTSLICIWFLISNILFLLYIIMYIIIWMIHCLSMQRINYWILYLIRQSNHQYSIILYLHKIIYYKICFDNLLQFFKTIFTVLTEVFIKLLNPTIIILSYYT